jgi:hypothetical protein
MGGNWTFPMLYCMFPSKVALLMRLKGETHWTRFDNAARFFSRFLKVNKTAIERKFKKYVNKKLRIGKFKPGSKLSVSENRKIAPL